MVGWFWQCVELLWPPTCAGCRTPGSWWCAACDDATVLIRTPACPRCNRITGTGRFCTNCRRRTALTGVAAGTYYREPVRSGIAALKYRHARVVAPRLASYLLPALSRIPGLRTAVIVPVPLHRRRLRQRGHNQAALLADTVARVTGLRVSDDLVRTRRTVPQTGLDRRQRQRNLIGAFRWTGPSLRGRIVVLVDDVHTTGTTLDACATELRKDGARQVWGLVLAKR